MNYALPCLRAMLLATLLFLSCLPAFSGVPDSSSPAVLRYAHGVRTGKALVLNVRGYEFVSEQAAGSLDKPYFAKMFPTLNLHKGYQPVPDSGLGVPALFVDRSTDAGFIGSYFVQQRPEVVSAFTVSGRQAPGRGLLQEVYQLVMHGDALDSLIAPVAPLDTILFVGRKIPVVRSCRWMGPNVLQCSGYGEMNWSMHPDEAEAAAQTAFQLVANQQNGAFTVDGEEQISVEFEGTAATARRIQYRVKGVRGLLARQEGSRTLIVYYVTAPVRGRYVSCVMSHWTSDYIDAATSLPPLLGVVMRLKQ